MAITKGNIKEILKRYMLQNNLGYIYIDASMSMDKSKVLMAITEEEEDINDNYYMN